MPDMPPSWLIQGGATSVLTLVVVLIILGRLWPLRSVEKLEKLKDEQIADYKAANRLLVQSNELRSQQVDELLEQGKVTLRMVESILKIVETSARPRD